eukprot:COSAG05_NODE_4100_length_1674_cov_30.712381_5_plen_60_part_01
MRWCFLQAWRTHQFRETIETSIRKYGDLQVQTKRNKTRPPPPPPPPPLLNGQPLPGPLRK